MAEDNVIHSIAQDTQLIHQQFSLEYDYKVLFTENLFDTGNALFLDLLRDEPSHQPRKIVFAIDSEVVRNHSHLIESIKSYCDTCPEVLRLCGEPLIIEGGESAKNRFELVEQILRLVENQQIDRHSYIAAIGGGAILDLVGFAAAIAHRGIQHIRIPTTVLSQCDSGVGVKNGINYFNKKNYLGTFSPPFAVINDTSFLSTLDDRDWKGGISEAIKVALIKDAEFFNWIEENTSELAGRDLPTMEKMIYQCAKHHLEHIATKGDPFEQGSSRPLDFGHWAAHKLEQITNYEVRHGEAVAMGIALDATYSWLTGKLEKSNLDRILKCFAKLRLEIVHPHLLSKDRTCINPEIVDGLEEFREHLGGRLTIMLLETIGKGVEVHQMDPQILDASMRELKAYKS